MAKIVINLLLMAIVILAEINFLPFFYPTANLNLALIMIIFIELLLSYKIALYWAAATGLIYDALSLVPFPFFTISFFLVIFLIKFLSVNLINPEPLHSRGRLINLKPFVNYIFFGLVAILFFDVIIYFLKTFYSLFFEYLTLDKFSWKNLFQQTFFDMSLLIIIILLANFLSVKFKIFPGKQLT